LFLNAVSDATPLSDRNRAPNESAPGRRRPPARDARAKFAIDRDGDFAEGRAHGVSRAQLADLRAGRVRAEAAVDLHGRNAQRARTSLLQFVDESVATGRRCVLVVHGRGLHSDEGPVLKEKVIEWLAGGGWPIRGFCTAKPRDGGAGALYVLLGKA